MATSSGESYDSSESVEDTANNTEVGWFYDNSLKGEDPGWRWDSAILGLPAVQALLAVLILVNILVFIRCATSLKKTLCDTFNDIVFYAFRLITSSKLKQCKSADRELPVMPECHSISMDVITECGPSPFCCLLDGFHENFLISYQNSTKNKFENKKEETTVDLCGKREKAPLNSKENVKEQRKVATGNFYLKKEQNRSVKKELMCNRNAEHFEAMHENIQYHIRERKDDLVDGYAGNLNVTGSSKKPSKKVTLQTVPEDQTWPVKQKAGPDYTRASESINFEMEKSAGPATMDLDKEEDVSDAEIFI